MKLPDFLLAAVTGQLALRGETKGDEPEGLERSPPCPHEHRLVSGQVDDGRRLAWTRAAIDDEIDLLFETIADFLGFVQRFVVGRQDQGRGDQGFAERLQQRLLPAEGARLIGRHSTDPEAYDNYLKGRYYFDQRTAASLARALSHFQRALEIDSTYARAHAGLADTYSILAWTGSGAPTELFAHSRKSALRANELDSTLAEAHVSLGIVHAFHDWNWAAADSESRIAITMWASARPASSASALVAAARLRSAKVPTPAPPQISINR